MTPLDPDRVLALSYVPSARRPAIEALWRLDTAFGAALAGGSEPLISQIKLTWWRDSLEKLDGEKAPAEPVLEGIARHVIPAGVSGEALSRMEAGWTAILSPDLTATDLRTYAVARGGLLFRYSAQILGRDTSVAMERGGERWALMDLARHSNPADAAAAQEAARAIPGDARWPAPLRPIGMLGALAIRDAALALDQLEPPGAPARMLRMLRHRLTGR